MQHKIIYAIFALTFLLACNQQYHAESQELASGTSDVQGTASVNSENSADFQEGDLIFQTSSSGQSLAVQLATHSPYSHCGILFKDAGKWFVYEAVQPVKKTPVDAWIMRGDDGKYVTKRLKDREKLSPELIEAMKKTYEAFAGKDYDLTFEWTDDRIYCSELIWKIYKRTMDIEIGQLQQLREFDLTSPVVKKIMKARYGDAVPLSETVISPASIFQSELLVTAKSN